MGCGTTLNTHPFDDAGIGYEGWQGQFVVSEGLFQDFPVHSFTAVHHGEKGPKLDIPQALFFQKHADLLKRPE